jgi:hypothetical protein
MDYTELLVAAEVRKLAVKLTNHARHAYADEIKSDPDAVAKVAQWEGAHRVDDYLEEAYNRIADVANKLESFERARIQKKLEGNRYAQARQQPPATSS